MRSAIRASLVGTLLLLPAGVLAGMLPKEGLGALVREPAGKLGLVFVLLALFAMDREEFIGSLRLRRVGWRGLAIAAGCGLLAMPLSQSLAALLFLPLSLLGAKSDAGMAYSATNDPVGLLIAIALVFFGVVVEEFFFRGYVLTRVETLGRREAIVLSASLFAVAHVSVLMVPWALILGGYTAILALHCRSIWPAVVAHGVGNTLGIVVHAWPEGRELLTKEITTVSHHTPWVLIGSLVIAVASGALLVTLVRRFLRVVPLVESEPPLLDRPRAVVFRSVSLWIYAALFVAINVALFVSMFRR